MSVLAEPLLRLAIAQPRLALLDDGRVRLDAAAAAREACALASRVGAHGGAAAMISLLDNGCDAVLATLGARLAGLVHVALPPFFSAGQLGQAVALVDPAFALGGPDAAPPGDGWREDARRLPGGSRLWRRDGARRPRAWPAGTGTITFTSGSTGTPRGVCLSDALLARVAASLDLAFEGLPLRRHLCALPLATLLEEVGVHAALLRGAELRVPPLAALGYSGATGLDPARLRASLATHAPDSLILVPQLLQGLLDALGREGPLPRPPRMVAVGGARVAPALLDRAAALGLPVFEGYGLSEAGSVVCLNRPGAARAGTVGRALAHQCLGLLPGGELAVDADGFLGYLGEPPRAPGRLATGDVAAVDADGFVALGGRRRYRIITAYGRNLSPEWVESELLARPAIAQALLVGDARPWNLALLVPAGPGVGDGDLAAAVRDANRSLPDYARVGGLLRLDQPFTAANGLLTGNGRPRREAILARHADAIEACYAGAPLPDFLPDFLPDTRLRA